MKQQHFVSLWFALGVLGIAGCGDAALTSEPAAAARADEQKVPPLDHFDFYVRFTNAANTASEPRGPHALITVTHTVLGVARLLDLDKPHSHNRLVGEMFHSDRLALRIRAFRVSNPPAEPFHIRVDKDELRGRFPGGVQFGVSVDGEVAYEGGTIFLLGEKDYLSHDRKVGRAHVTLDLASSGMTITPAGDSALTR
jgi:hypothetical protein